MKVTKHVAKMLSDLDNQYYGAQKSDKPEEMDQWVRVFPHFRYV